MTTSPPFSASVIIVNYNGGDYIQAALEAIRLQVTAPREILIVDNASTDGSADRLDLTGLDTARLIRLEDNLGFAKANNVGAAQAEGDWLVLLNPDTAPDPNWLAELASATERHPGVTSFAAAQIDAKNPAVLDGAGDCYSVYGFPWRGGFQAPRETLPEEGECFSACGASAMIRKDVFLGIGGFDESYFCYCEDVDLGYRLRLRGERCVFVPSALVSHHGSAITGRHSDFTMRLGTRNRLTTYLKNTPLALLILSLPAHAGLTLLHYLLSLGRPKAGSIRRGVMEGLARLPQTLGARRDVQTSKTLSSFDIARAMSWNPVRLSRRLSHVWSIKPARHDFGGATGAPPSDA